MNAVYFIGIGGIGMSAIARYYLQRGLVVGGYDKTPSALTHELEHEGALIHYEDDVNLIPEACRDARTTLIIYTPAIPAEHTAAHSANTANPFSPFAMSRPFT